MNNGRKILILFLIGLICSGSYCSREKVIAKIVLENDNHKRYDAPVSIFLNDLDINTNIKLLEIREGLKKEIPVQIDKSENKLYWILSGITEIGETRIFELWPDSENETDDLIANTNKNGILLKWKDKKLVQYQSVPADLQDGVDSVYTRGGFIHPLKTLSGRTLTRIQPDDHYHHVGIWNPWTKTTFQGREVDFWNLAKKQGTVRFKNSESLQSGNVFTGFNVNHEHIEINAPEGESAVMNEKWKVKVYQPGTNSYYTVDFTSVLECATDSSIALNQYRYGGGIGFRATELWNRENCNVLTSEGKTRIDADATHAKWCKVFGNIDNSTSGILFLCHPDNFEFPQPMRIWPEDANNGKGDMFFQFCPIRHKDWYLVANEKYSQQYRMIVYDGEIAMEQAEKLWQDYANPPKIFIHKEK